MALHSRDEIDRLYELRTEGRGHTRIGNFVDVLIHELEVQTTN